MNQELEPTDHTYSASKAALKEGQQYVDKTKNSLEGELYTMRPQRQTVLEAVKHCSLSSSLHIGIFAALHFVDTKIKSEEFAQFLEKGQSGIEGDDKAQHTGCHENLKEYQGIFNFMYPFHLTAGLILLSDLLMKAVSHERFICQVLDEVVFQRLRGLLQILTIGVVVAYHGAMIVVFKRFTRYEETMDYCTAFQEDSTALLGQMHLFTQLEIFLFFAQILSIFPWVIRQRMGSKNGQYLVGGEDFGDWAYEAILTTTFHKFYETYQGPKDSQKLDLNAFNGKTKIVQILGKYEIETTPNMINGQSLIYSVKDKQFQNWGNVTPKEWLCKWTNTSSKSLLKYRCHILNQIDIMELAPHKFQAFTLNFVQLFGSIALIAVEKNPNGGMVWGLYGLIGVLVLQNIMLYFERYYLMFIVELMLVAALIVCIMNLYPGTAIAPAQVIIKIWLVTNAAITVVHSLHMLLWIRKKNNMLLHTLATSINSAQINQDDIRPQRLAEFSGKRSDQYLIKVEDFDTFQNQQTQSSGKPLKQKNLTILTQDDVVQYNNDLEMPPLRDSLRRTPHLGPIPDQQALPNESNHKSGHKADPFEGSEDIVPTVLSDQEDARTLKSGAYHTGGKSLTRVVDANAILRHSNAGSGPRINGGKMNSPVKGVSQKRKAIHNSGFSNRMNTEQKENQYSGIKALGVQGILSPASKSHFKHVPKTLMKSQDPGISNNSILIDDDTLQENNAIRKSILRNSKTNQKEDQAENKHERQFSFHPEIIEQHGVQNQEGGEKEFDTLFKEGGEGELVTTVIQKGSQQYLKVDETNDQHFNLDSFRPLHEGQNDALGDSTQDSDTQRVVKQVFKRAENLQVQRIGDKSGQGIDVAVNGDHYTYAVLVHLNSQTSSQVRENLFQSCCLIGLVQLIMLGLFYIRVIRNAEVSPILMHYDFGLKFLCAFVMHLIVSPDLKQALDLMRYLKNPTQITQIKANRFLCCYLLMQKFLVGLLTETLLIITLAKTPEVYFIGERVFQNESLMQILMTFIVILLIYELPTFIFRYKMGWSQAQFMQIVAEQGELYRCTRNIDRSHPNTNQGQRSFEYDIYLQVCYFTFNEFYLIIYAYAYFYMLFVLQFSMGVVKKD